MSEHRVPDAGDWVVAEWAVVRPGDTLILRVSSTVSPERAQALASSLKERLPGVEVVFVGGIDQMAVYRPEGG